MKSCFVAATDQSESRDVVCKQSSSDDIRSDNQVSEDDNDDSRYYLAVLPDAPVSNRSSSISSIESIGDTDAEHWYLDHAPGSDADSDAKQSCI